MLSRCIHWYKRHHNAVDIILDIASEIPGAKLGILPIKLCLAKLRDGQELENEEKLKIVEEMLSECKSSASDLVEDIEEREEIQNASESAQKELVQRYFQEELCKVLPHLSQTMVRTMKIMSESKVKLLGGKYEEKKKIGQGGQAEVYEGWHVLANVPVAIKKFPLELSQDYNAIEKLKQEYQRVVTCLVHNNIVQYRDFGLDESSNRYYVVMDFVEGCNLRQKIVRERRAWRWEEVMEVFYPVSLGLEHAHNNRLVHRDMKPENIMISKSGHIYIADFSLASEVMSSMSIKGKPIEISGTMPYMSPEQYLGKKKDHRTDNWAVGVMLYELLEGQHPFEGTSFDHYMKLICEGEPEEPENLNLEQWNILRKLLRKERKERAENVRLVLEELNASFIGKHSDSGSSSNSEKPIFPFFPKSSAGNLEKDSKNEVEREWEKKRIEIEEAKKRLAREKEILEREKKKLEEEKEKERKKQEYEAELAAELAELERKNREIEAEKKKLEEEKARRREEELSKQNQGNFGLPSNIWSSCQYNYENSLYLDMTTDTWYNLSVPEQWKYASLYQENYAKSKNLQLEKTLHHSGVDFVLRLIPPGRFCMGNDRKYKVLLTKPYYLCKYEVTQGQWKAVMGKNPSYFTNSGLNAPVEQVSWDDCVAFCKKISGAKLPTEAQWEYACRAGVTCAYYFGDSEDNLGEYGWYDKNSGSRTHPTHPVGEKKPNAWQLYDMSGNVWEWCSDWYGDYINGEVTDSIGKNNGSSRVYRGGSWLSDASWLRSAFRFFGTPSDSFDFLGFRFLLEVS